MKILILEDDRVDALILERNLKVAFSDRNVDIEWQTAADLSELRATIGQYDICFLDLNLGAVTGLELIRGLVEFGTTTPLILVTGDTNPIVDNQALEAGACDFICKNNISAELLERCVRYSISRKKQSLHLAKLAYQDPLTGLSNRGQFDKRLHNLLADDTVHASDLLVILLDLDRFKEINDRWGHFAGDTVLVEVARRFRALFGDDDVVARIGGDEFGIILEMPNGHDGAEFIAALRSAFERRFTVETDSITCGCSVGFSIHRRGDPVPQPSSLLKIADRQLYLDKKCADGRFGSMELDGQLDGKDVDKILRSLSDACWNNDLVIQYQPIMTDFGNRVSCLEALARWPDNPYGLGPGQFIPLAEEDNTINIIGDWVVGTVCRQIRTWLDTNVDVVPIAVNVSPRQIETSAFVDMVRRNLRVTGIPPGLIQFELIEAAFVQRSDQWIDQMQQVAEIGCHWVIDDFGVGHSSFSRLHELPISKLKIDRSFLRKLPECKVSTSICNTIISLTRTLKLELVVEGVESPDQLNGLTLSDQDQLQGFFYHRPMVGPKIEALLRENGQKSAKKLRSPQPRLSIAAQA